MSAERVRVFTEGSFLDDDGNFRWGWSCFGCGEEGTGFGNATTAAEAANNHAALCTVEVLS